MRSSATAFFSYWINSYWGGAVAATGGALLLGALPRLRRKITWQHSIVFVVGLVILANSRPFEGLLFALPLCLAVMWLMFRFFNYFKLSKLGALGALGFRDASCWRE